MAQLWYKPSPPDEVHDTPWLSPDATRYLESLLRPNMHVLDNFNRPEYQAERESLEKRHRHLEFRFSFGLYLNTQFFFIGQKP